MKGKIVAMDEEEEVEVEKEGGRGRLAGVTRRLRDSCCGCEI